jgi:predicted RNase H-like HicB family nuclease
MLRFKGGSQTAKSSDGNLLTQNRDYRAHPLATTKVVTIEIEREAGTDSFVTFVKELHGISTFGDTEFEALELTAEMIRGYIKSMEERGMKVPLALANLVELKRRVALDRQG